MPANGRWDLIRRLKVKELCDESSGRKLLDDNTCGRTVMLWPIKFHCFIFWFRLCWSSDLNWTVLYTHIYLTVRVINSELHIIRLALEL